MRIDILCKPGNATRCQLILNNVRAALSQSKVEAEVHLYQDLRKMIDYRVHVSPAIVIDDDIRIAGRVPDTDEIVELIDAKAHYQER